MESNESIFNSSNILAYARRQAGGKLAVSDSLAARMELICRTLEKRSTLNNLGRKILIRQLAHNVINNCTVRQTMTENPAIAAEPVVAPIFITGLPRTGTSLLHRLMALDENHRALQLHEALNPGGFRGQHGYREKYAQMWSAVMNCSLPDIRHMIEVGTESPVECCFLKRNSLLCHSLSYQAGLDDLKENWLSREKLAACYDFYKLQLQLIQHQSHISRWLLKCPSHFPALEHIYSRFPDAIVICTSRDLSEVISSFTSLISAIRSNLSINPAKDAAPLELMQSIRLQIEMHHQFRNIDNRRSITDIHYKELARDPVGCVSSIYHHHGLHYSTKFEKKMSDWLRKNPHQKNGKHVHDPSMFGLSKKIIHEFFENDAKHMAEPIN